MEEAARIQALAAFMAAHAVPMLLAASALMLLGTWLAWRLIERIAPLLIDLARPVWRSLDTRRIAARYLGWHAAIAFLVAAGGLSAFFEVAGDIGAGEELAAFDLALAQALARELGPRALAFFGGLTRLGDPEWLIPLGAVIGLELLRRRERLLALSWVVATGGGALLNRGLKSLFARERPLQGQLIEHGFSFPSGHASGSMLVYGLAAYLLVRHLAPRWHLPVTTLAILVVVFVGASRVLLQVHYASDVLAGWVVAASWCALCVAGLEAVRLRGRATQTSGISARNSTARK